MLTCSPRPGNKGLEASLTLVTQLGQQALGHFTQLLCVQFT